MNVISMLNGLAESLRNNFDRINNGGCCVAAGMIGKYLKQYVPVRIAVSDYRGANGKNIDVIREIVNNSTCPCVWNDEGNLDFSHVIIEFDYEGETYHFDTDNGVVPASDVDPCFKYKIVEGRLTVEEAVALGQDSAGWNTRFERWQIPAMESMTSDHFHDFLWQR